MPLTWPKVAPLVGCGVVAILMLVRYTASVARYPPFTPVDNGDLAMLLPGRRDRSAYHIFVPRVAHD